MLSTSSCVSGSKKSRSLESVMINSNPETVSTDYDTSDLHVFMRERFEEKQIARVIIRRNRLRIGVDHHRLDPQLLHRKRGLHAAIVELDPLPDAVGAPADDDHLGFVGQADFVIDDEVRSL